MGVKVIVNVQPTPGCLFAGVTEAQLTVNALLVVTVKPG